MLEAGFSLKKKNNLSESVSTNRYPLSVRWSSTNSSHSALSSLQEKHPPLLCGAGPLTDFSQSDAPTGLSGHGRQSDPPRLPEPRLQLQQRCRGAGHYTDGLQGQMEQKDGFSLVCHWFCGGFGKCLEISVRMLSKRRW